MYDLIAEILTQVIDILGGTAVYQGKLYLESDRLSTPKIKLNQAAGCDFYSADQTFVLPRLVEQLRLRLGQNTLWSINDPKQ